MFEFEKKVHDKNLFSLQKEEFQKRQSKLKSLSPQSDLSLIASICFPKLNQIDATKFKYLLASEHQTVIFYVRYCVNVI